MVYFVVALAYFFFSVALVCLIAAGLALFNIASFQQFVADIAPPRGVISLILYACITIFAGWVLLRIASTVASRRADWKRRERQIRRAETEDRTLWRTPTPTHNGDTDAQRHPH